MQTACASMGVGGEALSLFTLPLEVKECQYMPFPLCACNYHLPHLRDVSKHCLCITNIQIQYKHLSNNKLFIYLLTV